MNHRNCDISSAKAVIFDMDGTLIDSTQADYHAWKRLFSEKDRELSYDDYFSLLGIRSIDVVRNTLKFEGDDIPDALTRKSLYFDEIVNEKGIFAMPFAVDLLHLLSSSNVLIGLATSSRKEKMEKVLEKTGLRDFFRIVVTGDEVVNGKPAPDIFIEAARKLEVDASECVVFEDAVSGVRAAKSAGMQCIAITTTHPAELLHEADMVISSFEEVYQQLLRQQPA